MNQALPTDRLAVSVDEACRILGCSRSTFYELLNAGSIASFTIGKRRHVAVEGLRDLVRRAVAAGSVEATSPLSEPKEDHPAPGRRRFPRRRSGVDLPAAS
jgi:excisionase family DNA binding protein